MENSFSFKYIKLVVSLVFLLVSSIIPGMGQYIFLALGGAFLMTAFASTDKNSFVDYIENIGQIFGETKQYSQAVKIAAKVNESLNKDNDKNMMTFIGHSLGGGQAAAASLKTGMPAITFNPAALSMKTKENLSITGQKGDVTNYVTIGKIIMSSEKLSIYIGGDPLYNAQSKTNLRLEGKTIFVKTNSMSLSHGIEDISKFL